jgi:hypothetical protein
MPVSNHHKRKEENEDAKEDTPSDNLARLHNGQVRQRYCFHQHLLESTKMNFHNKRIPGHHWGLVGRAETASCLRFVRRNPQLSVLKGRQDRRGQQNTVAL